MTDEQMKYPVGTFAPPASYTADDLRHWINDIKNSARQNAPGGDQLN